MFLQVKTIVFKYMTKSNLNVPVFVLHEMDNVQYKIAGELLDINEKAGTGTVKFVNGRVEEGIPTDVIYINEGFVDTIRKYGKKFANWIVEKIKGFCIFANPDGEVDENSMAHPVNMVAAQAEGLTPAFAKLFPSHYLIDQAKSAGVNGGQYFDEIDDFDGQAQREAEQINRFWTRVMNVAGTTEKTIKESVEFVNEKYYHDVFKVNKSLNEAGVVSLNPMSDGRNKRVSGGQIVHTKDLKAYVAQSIEGQVKLFEQLAIEKMDNLDAKGESGKYDFLQKKKSSAEYQAVRQAIRKETEKKANKGDNKFKPLLIFGAPGIGKTEIIRQCINEYRHNPTTPRYLAMYDLNCANLDGDSFALPTNIDTRAQEKWSEEDQEKWEKKMKSNTGSKKDSTFDMASLSWLPIYSPSDAAYNEEMEARFYRCEHLTSDGKPMLDDETGAMMQGGILFLDEVIRAHPSGFQSLMNICDRKLNEKRLARSWGIICAANRFYDDPTQESEESLESVPIQQRFTIITYVPLKSEWLEWARSPRPSGISNIEKEICDFIEAMPDYIWYRTIENGGYSKELEELSHDSDFDFKGDTYSFEKNGVSF